MDLTCFKVNSEIWKDGIYKDVAGGLEVNLSFSLEGNEAKAVNWQSNKPVYFVYVKGGPGGIEIEYAAGLLSGSGLVAPDNKGISHIAFYYKADLPGGNDEGGRGDDDEKGDNNGNGNGDGKGDDKGEGNNNTKTKFKVNFIKGCNPYADHAFFILNDGKRIDLVKNIITLENVKTEDIDKVGVILKSGKELIFEREEVLVESPKNENGTVVFKIECKDEKPPVELPQLTKSN